jgi:hypothetical protein
MYLVRTITGNEDSKICHCQASLCHPLHTASHAASPHGQPRSLPPAPHLALPAAVGSRLAVAAHLELPHVLLPAGAAPALALPQRAPQGPARSQGLRHVAFQQLMCDCSHRRWVGGKVGI